MNSPCRFKMTREYIHTPLPFTSATKIVIDAGANGLKLLYAALGLHLAFPPIDLAIRPLTRAVDILPRIMLPSWQRVETKDGHDSKRSSC